MIQSFEKCHFRCFADKFIKFTIANRKLMILTTVNTYQFSSVLPLIILLIIYYIVVCFTIKIFKIFLFSLTILFYDCKYKISRPHDCKYLPVFISFTTDNFVFDMFILMHVYHVNFSESIFFINDTILRL